MLFTGVPRSGRDDDEALERYMAAAEAEREAKGVDMFGEPAKPAVERAPNPLPTWNLPVPVSEPRRFYMTIERATETSPGAVIEATYTPLSNGTVRVEADGKHVGVEHLKPGDDPEVVARRLLRSKYASHGDFYGPINYGRRMLN